MARPAAPLPGPHGFRAWIEGVVRHPAPSAPSGPQAQQPPPTLAARPLSMQSGFWQRSPFSSSRLRSSAKERRGALLVGRGPGRVRPRQRHPGSPGPRSLPDQRTVGRSPQCTLQRRAVSLSLLNANLSAQESVCRALFLLQLPREIIQIPGRKTSLEMNCLPLSVPLMG